jgi:mRNA interferase MazF
MPKQGTIVLVPFPFTDLSATKMRPALVLSAKPLKSDVLVAFISSKLRQGEYHVPIPPTAKNGLKVPSVVICSKLATLEKTVILGELGRAEGEVITQVKSKLATILDL